MTRKYRAPRLGLTRHYRLGVAPEYTTAQRAVALLGSIGVLGGLFGGILLILSY